jgi:hypothetical protein
LARAVPIGHRQYHPPSTYLAWSAIFETNAQQHSPSAKQPPRG